jgi:hypothetical protein
LIQARRKACKIGSQFGKVLFREKALNEKENSGFKWITVMCKKLIVLSNAELTIDVFHYYLFPQIIKEKIKIKNTLCPLHVAFWNEKRESVY